MVLQFQRAGFRDGRAGIRAGAADSFRLSPQAQGRENQPEMTISYFKAHLLQLNQTSQSSPTVPPNGDQVGNQMAYGGHSHLNHHIPITLNKYIQKLKLDDYFS